LADIKRACSSCTQIFVVGVAEQAWFDSRGFELPKRCKLCRQRRRGRRHVDERELESDSHREL